MNPCRVPLITVIAAIAGSASHAGAQFSLDWSTIEPGGSLASPSFSLVFVVSQPDVGSALVSAGFTLSGGFLAGTSSVALHCPSDLDDGSGTGQPDGGTDVNDLLYFLASFEAGSISGADLDDGSGMGIPDGGVDINDLLFFLAHFEAGC
jgi:hypothetical protein